MGPVGGGEICAWCKVIMNGDKFRKNAKRGKKKGDGAAGCGRYEKTKQAEGPLCPCNEGPEEVYLKAITRHPAKK